MLTANDGLKENNEDTSPKSLLQTPWNHDSENELDTCQDAYQKAKMAKKELDLKKG